MNGTDITNSGTFREKRWKLYTRNIVSNIIVMESHELSDSQMKWTVFPFGIHGMIYHRFRMVKKQNTPHRNPSNFLSE